MNPQDPFLTDEEFRYAAECRRLARLARRPPAKNQNGPATLAYSRLVAWFGNVSARYIHPPRHQQLARISRHR
jgi:hypothetical protein